MLTAIMMTAALRLRSEIAALRQSARGTAVDTR